jgi:hypothetical protein
MLMVLARAQETKFAVKPRNVHFHIVKADKDADFWPRLLKDKNLEKTNVRINWDLYVDEDDDGAGNFDLGGMGMGDASVRVAWCRRASVRVPLVLVFLSCAHF